MAEELEGKCMWKNMAENDRKKAETGEGSVTLRNKDEECYKCDGTIEYAKRINCKDYVDLNDI
ncbi:MAG: hypothetical protein ABIH72_00290 [archaeon]